MISLIVSRRLALHACSTLATLSCCIALSSYCPSPIYGQEKIKINESTSKIVPSAWELVEGLETKASLRGLHVLDQNNIWASGTGGTIINSSDGGRTWKVQQVTGAEELDFRDIHAIDDGTIVAMTSGTPARIYRSTNGGLRWKVCYEQTDERVFLDALSFWNDQEGIIMGDPIGNALLLLMTRDGGRTWNQLKSTPGIKAGEAGFAASGTNAITIGESGYYIALGAAEKDRSQKTSRILFSNDQGSNWFAANAAIPRSPSAGIFSLCFADAKHGVAVGGDYLKPEMTSGNFAFTSDGGRTWNVPKKRMAPSGYRSCVAVARKGREIRFVAVGPNGTDVSMDMGKKWQRISNEGFHAVDFTKDGQHGWATGSDGRIARWTNQFDKKIK